MRNARSVSTEVSQDTGRLAAGFDPRSSLQFFENRMLLPIARTEPLCFSDVDGLRSCAGMAGGSHGSAKIGVGDGAASCELKAPFVASGPLPRSP